MKLLNSIFIMSTSMALVMAITIATVENIEEAAVPFDGPYNPTALSRPLPEVQPHSLRGIHRFLVQDENPRAVSCHKNENICLAASSPGSQCCKRKCVDVATDHMNCGSCGNICKYTEACCRGQCVNLSFDKQHCGWCNNRCHRGDFCIYGMCNYV